MNNMYIEDGFIKTLENYYIDWAFSSQYRCIPHVGP